ncbi:hypothetical protein NDU88_007883 [Pleurodeles waltl]|uniref:Uncharacterized protein n=1 Tax=Pleurodeles waltl TaxID=8319 RepID=A0AAV7SU75_PLEWA|nr:hypothetical protein NDU88_007883 [Pleurodeles waltl]
MAVKSVYELLLDGPIRGPLRLQICTCTPPTQPQEEERAWKCLHRFLLSCRAPHPSYHTPPAESYAIGSISKSSELPNSAHLASGNKQIQQIRPAAASWASYGVGKTRKQYIGNAGHHDPYEEVWFVVLQASVHEVSAGVVGLMMKSGGLVLMALGLQCQLGQ